MADRKFTTQEMIDALKAAKGIQTVAANRLGCARMTVSRYIKEFPTVAAALEEANESVIDFAESKLLKNIDEGDTTSIIFFLKTRGKNRGYSERQEVTGAVALAGAVFAGDIDDVLDDDEQAEIAGMMREMASKKPGH